MTKTIQEINNEIVTLLADVESALQEDEYDEAISALDKVLALKKEKEATGVDLADAYYDLASAHLSATKSCDKSEEKAHLVNGISFVELAKRHYSTTQDNANDLNHCHVLLLKLKQRLETLNKPKSAVSNVEYQSNSAKTQYRQFLLSGTLFKSIKIVDNELHLEINSPWNTKKGFAGVRKMLTEIRRDRPAFRERLAWTTSDRIDFVKLIILDKKLETPENYLKFIQEQGVTQKNHRYLNRISQGNIIAKVIKKAETVTLELASSLSKEDVFSLNVALYNKYIKSAEFQKYFGTPKKNRDYPTMALKEPAKALSEEDIKALICRLCANDKREIQDSDVSIDSQATSNSIKSTSDRDDETSSLMADDQMELANIVDWPNPSYLPSYLQLSGSKEAAQPDKILVEPAFIDDNLTEESLKDWLKLIN